MNTFVTGATGFIGQYLIPRLLVRGDDVWCLSRSGKPINGCTVVKGDITQSPITGEELPQMDAVYHLAGLVDLGKSKRREIWETNVDGAHNVLRFMVENKAKAFYHVGTAYPGKRPPVNTYELSKIRAQQRVELFREIYKTPTWIYRPSITIGGDSQIRPPGSQSMYQFVSLIARVHRRMEIIRRNIESGLRLPEIRPVFKIQSKPDARINLIPVNVVADFILEPRDPGEYWVTNPSPPTMQELFDWFSDVLLVTCKADEHPRFTPVEAVFHRLATPFIPYMKDNDLPSDLPSTALVNKTFVQESISHTLLQNSGLAHTIQLTGG